MNYKVLETESARRELEAMLAYAATSEGKSAASALADAVSAEYDKIAENPGGYAQPADMWLQSLGYREAATKGCAMLFVVSDSKKEVTVTHYAVPLETDSAPQILKRHA